MNHTASLERAKAYLDAQISRPAGAADPHSGTPEGPFVTISREAGSGGSTLAQMLADHLNASSAEATTPAWTVFDQNLVEEVLRTQQLSPQLARFLPEDKVSEVESSVRELVGLHPNLWTLVQQTNHLIVGLARRGYAIIVGRGGNLATAAVRNGIDVRLVAPPHVRAENMARRLRIPVAEAATHNRQLDAARRDYVRSVFDANIADPNAYDLVINIARTTPRAIVEMLTPLLREKAILAERARSHAPASNASPATARASAVSTR